jgi:hypothetical protein
VLRTIAIFSVLLAGAPSAAAATIQLTNTGTVTAPSCPANPCAAISRTTAIQSADGAGTSPFVITEPGRITAWSVTLALPDRAQIHYFDKHEQGTARAAIGVLRNLGDSTYELVAKSPVVHLQPWFGKTATIRLRRPLRVKPTETIALIVPTWVPALALNFPADTTWAASRASGQCTDVALQTVQDVVGSQTTYACSYPTGQVTYAATERTR